MKLFTWLSVRSLTSQKPVYCQEGHWLYNYHEGESFHGAKFFFFFFLFFFFVFYGYSSFWLCFRSIPLDFHYLIALQHIFCGNSNYMYALDVRTYNFMAWILRLQKKNGAIVFMLQLYSNHLWMTFVDWRCWAYQGRLEEAI